MIAAGARDFSISSVGVGVIVVEGAAVIHLIVEGGSAAVIPPKSNRRVQRDFDHQQYKHRNLIERFFCRLKQFRRIATRYDKLVSRFSSFIALAAACIWLA